MITHTHTRWNRESEAKQQTATNWARIPFFELSKTSLGRARTSLLFLRALEDLDLHHQIFTPVPVLLSDERCVRLKRSQVTNAICSAAGCCNLPRGECEYSKHTQRTTLHQHRFFPPETKDPPPGSRSLPIEESPPEKAPLRSVGSPGAPKTAAERSSLKINASVFLSDRLVDPKFCAKTRQD